MRSDKRVRLLYAINQHTCRCFDTANNKHTRSHLSLTTCTMLWQANVSRYLCVQRKQLVLGSTYLVCPSITISRFFSIRASSRVLSPIVVALSMKSVDHIKNSLNTRQTDTNVLCQYIWVHFHLPVLLAAHINYSRMPNFSESENHNYCVLQNVDVSFLFKQLKTKNAYLVSSSCILSHNFRQNPDSKFMEDSQQETRRLRRKGRIC